MLDHFAMTKTTFRAFIAIDIPENIKETICKKIVNPLQKNQELEHIKWTKKENLHITLVFLGNITEQQYQEINKKVKENLASSKPFVMKLTTLEPFPSKKKFHALVLQPQPLIPLKKLASLIKNGIETREIQANNRQFKPHLTLGRLKGRYKIDDKILKKIKLPAMHFEVTAIKLFKSELQSEGSVYTPVATYDFIRI